MENRLKVGITQGDVNGISYELIIKLLAENRICELCTPVLYGSPKVAAYYRKALNVENFSLNTIREASEANPKRGNVVNCVDDNVKVDIGQETSESDTASMTALAYALGQLDKEAVDVLVVTPQGNSSFALEEVGCLTEYLSKRYNKPEAMSILVNDNIKIGFVTEYVKFRDVPHQITVKNIERKLNLLNDALKLDFTIQKPKIAVLGLNPQVDCKQLTEEEINVIHPAIERAREKGVIAIGPFAADRFFAEQMYKKFDAVLAMYHDQGAVPFSTIQEDNGAFYVAGVPVVCASSLDDAGYDIAGQGIADEQGLRNAVYLAMDVFNNRQQNLSLQENPLPHYDIASGSNETDLNVEQIEGVREEIDD
ncbi:PdxA family dehydrogenase [Gabonibacter chumensis]|uniref:PdxA family dehydrogenase n=1 Tax=Gabonibacter chumensis TaxID=2972474 RepID=UPI0025744817|nr:4-hydroxythreonine-4-phosphate dehydrogenase PdxA [Gabonibacter chumensis]MCR9012855.1 4-hydroxythreonine-4-phosphate dehydrogenase PdxA [Gabonibacter chumensis]